MSAEPNTRWTKLTDEQIQGAQYALRLIRTSPRIRGMALEMLDGILDECEADMRRRQEANAEAAS